MQNPLAAIETRVELGFGETDPAEIDKTLLHLKPTTSKQVVWLISLSLARATPDAGGSVFECIDMNASYFLITLDMLHFTLTKNIDLGLKA